MSYSFYFHLAVFSSRIHTLVVYRHKVAIEDSHFGIQLDYRVIQPLTLTVFQLYAATLDNTGNNNTTCQTIEDIHVRRGLKWNSNEQQLPCVLIFLLS